MSLDDTIVNALAGIPAGSVLSFDSLRPAAEAAQLGPKQLHGQSSRPSRPGTSSRCGRWSTAWSTTCADPPSTSPACTASSATTGARPARYPGRRSSTRCRDSSPSSRWAREHPHRATPSGRVDPCCHVRRARAESSARTLSAESRSTGGIHPYLCRATSLDWDLRWPKAGRPRRTALVARCGRFGFRCGCSSTSASESAKRGARRMRSTTGEAPTPAFIATLEDRFGRLHALDVAAAPHNARAPCSTPALMTDPHRSLDVGPGVAQSALLRLWRVGPRQAWRHRSVESGRTTGDADRHSAISELIVMLLPANRVEQKWWQEQRSSRTATDPTRPCALSSCPGRMRFDRPGWTPWPGRVTARPSGAAFSSGRGRADPGAAGVDVPHLRHHRQARLVRPEPLLLRPRDLPRLAHVRRTHRPVPHGRAHRQGGARWVTCAASSARSSGARHASSHGPKRAVSQRFRHPQMVRLGLGKTAPSRSALTPRPGA